MLLFALGWWLGQTFLNFVHERAKLRDKVCQLQQSLAHATIELQRDTISDDRPVVSQPAIVIDRTDYRPTAS